MQDKRRDLLKALTLGGGAVAATRLPANWSKPVVDSVMLPLHAQTTGVTVTVGGGGGLDANPVVFDSLLGAFVPDAHAIGNDYPGCAGFQWRFVDGVLDESSIVLDVLTNPNDCPDIVRLQNRPMTKIAPNEYRYDDGYPVTLYLENPAAGVGELVGRCQVNLYNQFDVYLGATCPTECLIPSDRHIKEDFSSVDADEILRKVGEMPIEYWSYTDRDHGVRHIGPMAQDFHAAFNVGDSDRHIHMVDANGVNLASIQALYRGLLDKDQRIQQLESDLSVIKEKLGIAS